MWDRPGSGIKPVSPVLAGGFFSTEPQGKHQNRLLTWRKKKRVSSTGQNSFHLSTQPSSRYWLCPWADSPQGTRQRQSSICQIQRKLHSETERDIFSSISLVLRTLFPEALWQTFPLPPMPRILTLKSVTGKRD